MDLSWLWQGFVSNVIWVALVALGGVVLAVLRSKWPKLFMPVVWFFIGCFLVAGTIAAGFVIARMPKPAPQVTQDNAEANIRAWIDNFGWSLKKTEDPLAHWKLLITLENGTPISVGSPKKLDRYITLQTAVQLTPEQQAQMEKFTAEENRQVVIEVQRELARAKIESWADADVKPTTITMGRQYSIGTLTEPQFLLAVQDMDAASRLLRMTIVAAFADRKAR
jgi:hypothetical protein